MVLKPVQLKSKNHKRRLHHCPLTSPPNPTNHISRFSHLILRSCNRRKNHTCASTLICSPRARFQQVNPLPPLNWMTDGVLGGGGGYKIGFQFTPPPSLHPLLLQFRRFPKNLIQRQTYRSFIIIFERATAATMVAAIQVQNNEPTFAWESGWFSRRRGGGPAHVCQ